MKFAAYVAFSSIIFFHVFFFIFYHCVCLYAFVEFCKLRIFIFMFIYSYCYVCSVLYIVSLYCFVYCLCVNVYSTTATGCQPNFS
jgi:hypothetical protein